MDDMSGALGIITEVDVEMPMRDGVVLRGNVFRPDGPGQFPGLLMRTPYGKPAAGFERYVRAGYVVVTQDTRGRYASEGEFVIFSEETLDGRDGYDSIEWLAEQPYCNGDVGTMGVSYNAWMQWQAAKLRPPSLKAMCANSIPVELTEVDWPSAFRPGRRIRWWMTTMAPDLRKREGLPPPHTPAEASRIWEELEHGRWLGLLPWIDICKYFPERLAEQAESWLCEPNRRAWRFDEAHAEIEVPNLDFSGWYDHCGGSVGHLPGMQRNGRTELAREQTKLIIGPWNHVSLGARTVGEIDYGPQAGIDKEGMTIRWFDRWLKGHDNGIDREPAVRYFMMGENAWRNAPTWPPEPAGELALHLRGEGGLSAEPAGDEPPDEYDYDPADPVPTLWNRALFAGASDRRALEHRQDIVNYRSEPLAESVEVVGCPEMVLFAASSAPDTDFFVRLIDEHPDGPALDMSHGMVRARHRNGYDKQELLTPGEVTEFRIKMGPTAIRFAEGHRIRVEITSSNFPDFDRNHNTGGNDLMETELRVARQVLVHTREQPSRVVLPTA